MKKIDVGILAQQIVPVCVSGGISYYSGVIGQLIGLGVGLFAGGFTAIELTRLLRRQDSYFSNEAFLALEFLIKRASLFYATSVIPFKDWLSPAAIHYLILQGRKKLITENFEFKRIFLLKKNKQKYVMSEDVGWVLGLHCAFGLYQLQYLEVKDNKMLKNFNEYDFSYVKIKDNDKELKLVVEPEKFGNRQVSIRTYWCEDSDSRQHIKRKGIIAQVDKDKVAEREKQIQNFERQSCDFISLMKCRIPFFDSPSL